MSAEQLTVAVVGAGGKMGMRVSANLQKSSHTVTYSENSAAGQDRVRAEGREITATDDAVQGVAHPCHRSVFLERTTKEEWADTFGGEGAPQNVVAAIDEDAPAATRDSAEAVIRTIYAPVIDVHWVTVKQLAILEPTLVETVACMIGTLLNEALHETVHTAGVPEEAAKAMLFGHVQIALTNALRGSNPFSEACEIAIQYGKDTIIKDDWKKIFDDSELDSVIARMLKLDAVKR